MICLYKEDFTLLCYYNRQNLQGILFEIISIFYQVYSFFINNHRRKPKEILKLHIIMSINIKLV